MHTEYGRSICRPNLTADILPRANAYARFLYGVDSGECLVLHRHVDLMMDTPYGCGAQRILCVWKTRGLIR